MPYSGGAQKFDCLKCIEHRLPEQRNCGGDFPDSRYAKDGYWIGSIKVHECPKTFVKRKSIEILKFFDALESARTPLSQNAKDLPNRTMQFLSIIREERAKIEQSILDQRKSKESLSGL